MRRALAGSRLELATLMVLAAIAGAGCARGTSASGGAVVAVTGGSTAAGAERSPLEERLDRALDSARVELGARGATAAMILPDGSVWEGASGEAFEGLAATSETVFETGSITKTFTAALVLRLVEEGVLSLEDSVERWIPESTVGRGVTIRQLLNHTSGIYDVLQDSRYLPAMISNPAKRWTVAESLEFAGAPTFAPGAGWAYSNTGYLLLGEILERATGEPVAWLYQERLFGPLGLEQTVFAAADGMPEGSAHAFLDITGDGEPEDLTAMIPTTAFISSAWTAGGVASTAGELARWMRALHGGQVVGSSSWAEMTRLVDRPDGARYGLGLLVVDRDGRVLWGHQGNSTGFSAAVWHVPADDLTIAVLTNAHLVMVRPIVTALLEAL